MTSGDVIIGVDDGRPAAPARLPWAAIRWVVILGLLLGAAGPAWAGFDDGMAAAKRGNHETAFNIWLPLAEQGDIRAQYNLGVLYDRGLGVPQSFAEATRWYQIAAERGHVDAQANLGFAYERGRGVGQDFAQAAEWYLMAAERGDVAAQANLGALYANGSGVAQDDVQAHMWLNLAAARAKGNVFRYRLRKKRDGIAARMTPEQLSEAQLLAQEWQPKAP